jgi:predicted nucleic acid-binding Zn ribbon protein
MPIYSAECKNCGNKQNYTRSIAERNETPICCEVPMTKVLDAPGGFVDLPAAGKRVWGKPGWQTGNV